MPLIQRIPPSAAAAGAAVGGLLLLLLGSEGVGSGRGGSSDIARNREILERNARPRGQ